MKKIFTLILALFATYSVSYAQSGADELDETFKFVTADGTEVPNGSTWTVNVAEQNDFGTTQIKSGLFLKNTLDEKVGAQVTLDVQKLPNGNMLFCMLGNCSSYSTVGLQTKQGRLNENAKDDLQLEWEPTAYGECVTKLHVDVIEAVEKEVGGNKQLVYGDVIGNGPTITVKFVYADPTGIHSTTHDGASVVARYNALGQRISATQKGLNILVLSNGKTIKQYQK